MSGPKCYGYSVYDAVQLEQRRRRDARAQADAWRTRIAELRESIGRELERDRELEMPAVGDAPDRPAEDASADTWESHVDQLRQHYRSLEDTFRDDAAAVRSSRMLRSIRGDLEGTARSATDAIAQRSGSDERSDAETADGSIVEDAVRVAGRLHEHASEDEGGSVETLLASIQAEAPSRARELLLQLRHVVRESNRAAEDREAQADEATDLRGRLGARGVSSDGLAAALLEVERGQRELDEELRLRVQRALERAEGDEERSFVADAAEAVLRDLGYEVQTGFETVFVEDGFAHFQRSGWGDYAVRVRIDDRRDQLHFRVVRPRADDTQDQQRRDAEVERDWCEEVGHVLDGLRERGISMELEHALDAGAVPVVEVDDTGISRSSRRAGRTRRREPQQRPLGAPRER